MAARDRDAADIDADALVARLSSAAQTLDDRRDAVDEHGEGTLRSLRAALREVDALFERHEEDATGYGEFEAYLAFQDDLVDTVEDLDSDLPERDAFESLLDLFKKQTLSHDDFDAARDRLADARSLADTLDALDDARDAYDAARRDVKRAHATLTEETDRLERLQRLGDADLDAPVDAVRDPLETYNDRVRDAFADFRREASAREVVALADRATAFPLVDLPAPPSELRDYLANREVGDRSLAELRDFAGYSRSKLDHYVDDPATLKRVVGGNTSFLDRLSGSRLTLDWPPAERGVLRYRTRELISVVDSFAGAETLTALRDVRDATRRDDYPALRNAAVANAELTDEERERVRTGSVAAELDAARDRRNRLARALDDYPAL
ncbi:DUF7118 family protein [Halocalculus aciditolerans]|uniref:Uncharacterized protein n=1 Tax=Halocalculus aciditolerans TaxID=1383812 RepID=A0A830FFI4_9EURY|nr:hypothetical protein [Halocalculus aciditolerans]GGL48163.1 hypothetical protein GCM10009039_02960 [Halocalculus aciditolerans]